MRRLHDDDRHLTFLACAVPIVRPSSDKTADDSARGVADRSPHADRSREALAVTDGVAALSGTSKVRGQAPSGGLAKLRQECVLLVVGQECQDALAAGAAVEVAP